MLPAVAPRLLLAVLPCALALSGCAVPARDRSLAGLDLSNPQVISALQKELSGKERGALATYALLHWPGSKAYCGQPMFRGPLPTTIGEAIARTIEFENDLAAKRAAERQPLSAPEARAMAQRQLTDRFEEMELDLLRLQSSTLPAAAKARQLASMRKAMARNRQNRAALAATSQNSR